MNIGAALKTKVLHCLNAGTSATMMLVSNSEDLDSLLNLAIESKFKSINYLKKETNELMDRYQIEFDSEKISIEKTIRILCCHNIFFSLCNFNTT